MRHLHCRTAVEAHLSLTQPPAGGRRMSPAFFFRSRTAMAIAYDQGRPRQTRRDVTAWDRLKTDKNWLGAWFMLPAAIFLILFLAYPLGLGIWLSFTDARLGRGGEFIGLENYDFLRDDPVFWLSVFN